MLNQYIHSGEAIYSRFSLNIWGYCTKMPKINGKSPCAYPDAKQVEKLPHLPFLEDI